MNRNSVGPEGSHHPLHLMWMVAHIPPQHSRMVLLAFLTVLMHTDPLLAKAFLFPSPSADCINFPLPDIPEKADSKAYQTCCTWQQIHSHTQSLITTENLGKGCSRCTEGLRTDVRPGQAIYISARAGKPCQQMALRAFEETWICFSLEAVPKPKSQSRRDGHRRSSCISPQKRLTRVTGTTVHLCG